MLIQLLEFVKDADKAAFEGIYRAYERKMYAVALNILHNHHDAEDAVYASFEKIIEHFEKIILLSCNQQGAYIVTIVKNISRNMLKRKARYMDFPDEWDMPDLEPGPEADAEYCRLVALVRAMPDTYREVLERALVLEEPLNEIAVRMKSNLSTVKSRLSRGRKQLQEKLVAEGYQDGRQKV